MALRSATEQVSHTGILNSWKEIAAYVSRGVRTVQRYEEQFGFPVHRPSRRTRSAVVAFTEEIDLWLRSTPEGAFMRLVENTECGAKDVTSDLETAKKAVEEAYEAYQFTLRRYYELRNTSSRPRNASNRPAKPLRALRVSAA